MTLEKHTPHMRGEAFGADRVAVAAGHFVMAMHFFADIPPTKPRRPSLNIRSIALVCRSFMASRKEVPLDQESSLGRVRIKPEILLSRATRPSLRVDHRPWCPSLPCPLRLAGRPSVLVDPQARI